MDDNEQHLAYQRAINHAFADIVDNYGPRPSYDDYKCADYNYSGPAPIDHNPGNHPSLAGDDYFYDYFGPDPQDYCIHDPLRDRCRGRRGDNKYKPGN